MYAVIGHDEYRVFNEHGELMQDFKAKIRLVQKKGSLSEMKFTKGDIVSFTSKFGDRVTGVYQGESSIPGIVNGKMGEIAGHNILAKPFPDVEMEVLCWVPLGEITEATAAEREQMK